MTSGSPDRRADEARALLERMHGRWEGTARLWLEPGVLKCEDAVTGTFGGAHGGRWTSHEYATTIDGARETGTALLGFDLLAGVWQVAWVDTWHTGSGIMFLQGPLDPGSGVVAAAGSYPAPDGPPWGWRTTFEPADGTLLVRHYNVTPAGDEALAVELDYRRA